DADFFLWLRLAIDVNGIVGIADMFAGQANDTLDEITGIVRGNEHHYIAPLRLAYRNDFGSGNGQPYAIGVFVHDNEVANVECRNHGAGGNLKGLEQKRPQNEY